jgi:hypothetical protein
MSLIGSDLVGEVHTYHMYPLTIIFDRYTGCYSGGKVTVWNTFPENIPDEIFSDDNTCDYFWLHEAKDCKFQYGIGDTIQEAIDDLYFKDTNLFININGNVWWPMNFLANMEDDYHDPHFSQHSFTVSDAQQAIDEYKRKKREHEEQKAKEEL